MIRIERMNADHVPQIAEIERLCFNDPWSENSIATELSSRISLWLVALDGDRVVGYVGSQSVLGETDMMNIAVHPDYRRQGIAEKLVLSLVDALKAKGNYCLTLEVRASNEPAIRVYRALDFVEVGRRKNYYRNPREDACILRKEF